MRFYLIDKATRCCPGKWLEAVKCVSLSEDVFNEHFPGYPIFPGSLILEGLAQASGILLEQTLKEQGYEHRRAILSLVEKLKFYAKVSPGDCLTYRVEIKSLYPDEYAAVTVKATAGDGKIRARGELLFSFMDIDDPILFEATDRLVRFSTKDMEIVR